MKNLMELPNFEQQPINTNVSLSHNLNESMPKRSETVLIPSMIPQDLYDDIIGESSPPIPGYPNPPLEYKNGLIHDVMDDDEHDLQWRVEP